MNASWQRLRGALGPGTRAVAVIAIMLATSICTATIAYFAQVHNNRNDAAERFAALAQRVKLQIDERLHRYEYGLRGARGVVVAADGTTTREAFGRYASSRVIEQEFPGARGFGIIWRVAESDERRFVQGMHASGLQDFSVRQFGPHTGERFVITYVEPLALNKAAIGLDIASEPKRREAAQLAAASGNATLSAPLTLVQASGSSSRGLLLLLPIYRTGLPGLLPQDRERALIGWSYAPLLIDEVMRGLDVEEAQFSLQLHDMDADASTAFYSARQPDAIDDHTLEVQQAVNLYGRRWEARLRPTQAFITALHQNSPRTEALEALLLGLACSGLIATLLQLMDRARGQRLEQARRAAIVDGSSDAVIVQTLDGVITDWNDGAARLFGYAIDQAKGRTATELLLPPGLEGEDESMRTTVARGERVQVFETVRRASDGELIPVSITASPIRDGKGQVVGAAKILRDVREARAAEQRMRELNASLEDQVRERTALLEAAQRDSAALLQTLHQHAIVSVADRAGRIIDVNEGFCRISGYTRDELLGRNHRVVNSGSHPPEFWQGMWATISSGRSWRGEVCNRAKNGSRYWVDSVVAPFLDAQGRVEKYISIRTNISDRKRTELEFQRTMTLLRTVLEASTQVSIIAADPAGKVSVFNKGSELLLGYRAAEVVGQVSALQFLDNTGLPDDGRQGPPDALPLPDGRLALLHDATLSEPRVWSYLRRDGSQVPVSMALTRMRDEHGELLGYLAIAHDISARLAHEASLRSAMQQAREANEAKSRFLANMSHEIRTPMNAVIGLSHVLGKSALNPDQAGLLARIDVASKGLMAIINDVLDLSKIEAGEMRLEAAPFDLDALVRDVTSLISVAAEDKGIAFAADVQGEPTRTLVGDSTRLRQVLLNLLSNAVKFTVAGGVRLLVQVAAADAPGEPAVDLCIRVKDSGIGIPADVQGQLFQPFVQADTSTTRRFGGTGLGLSIVRQLVALMGGQITLSSTPGQGSEFQVRARLPVSSQPLEPAATGPLQRRAGPGLAGLRLLVVDDIEMNREVAARILQGEGARVVLKANGQEAVDALLGDGPAFDAVLMDVQMPVLDGLQATRRIRQAPGLLALPVIGLTAGVAADEQRLALAAGMNTVVGKPFDPETLVLAIRRLAAAAPASAEDMSEPPAAAAGCPADWPRLDGVDARLSFRQLKGDTALLRRVFEHTLATLRELAAAADTGAAPDRLAGLLHDLKGMAGTLGAAPLRALAGEAERLLRAGDSAAAQPLLAAIAALAAGLEGQRERLPAAAPAAAAAAAPAPLQQQALAALMQRLTANDLSAQEAFRPLMPALRQRLGDEAFARLETDIDSLAFDATRQTLEDARLAA
ncbi:PAS domain S-box protein [Roseateles sp. LYH14W]|uniref:histidine kinase n=1 Tax=Pelomonas parva TaxID=3299032 RepID=A0ABW7F1A3_9BURK